MASGRVSKVKGKVVDIPNAPTIGTATAGGESVSIAFTAYSGGAGGPTRSYIAKSNPGNITATGSTSPISVTGLTAGTSYTISVAGVNETGTGEYSSASGSAVPTVASSYESIATVSVGSGGSSSVTFSSIPSTYTHLQIRAIARNTGTGNDTFTALRFNGTGGSTFQYATHYLIGTGSAVVSGTNAPNVTDIFSMVTWGSGSSMNSNVFSAGIIDILDYASTSKNKTVRTLTGVNGNGIGQIDLTSGFWNNTNAVNQIELLPQSGSFGQYSSFALYGIKGA